MSGIQEQQKQFMEACGQNLYSVLDWLEPQNRQKRAEMQAALKLYQNLINEEVYKELFVHLDAVYGRLVALSAEESAEPMSISAIVKILDDTVDAAYVLMGLANVLGLPFREGWDVVQASNMAKRGPDGKVLRREDGKILKPNGWKEPDLMNVIRSQINEEHLRKQPWQARLIQLVTSLHVKVRKQENLDMMIKDKNIDALAAYVDSVAKDAFRLRMVIVNERIKQQLSNMEKQAQNGTD